MHSLSCAIQCSKGKGAGKGHILFLDQTTKGTLEAKMGEGHTGAIWGKCCSK